MPKEDFPFITTAPLNDEHEQNCHSRDWQVVGEGAGDHTLRNHVELEMRRLAAEYTLQIRQRVKSEPRCDCAGERFQIQLMRAVSDQLEAIAEDLRWQFVKDVEAADGLAGVGASEPLHARPVGKLVRRKSTFPKEQWPPYTKKLAAFRYDIDAIDEVRAEQEKARFIEEDIPVIREVLMASYAIDGIPATEWPDADEAFEIVGFGYSFGHWKGHKVTKLDPTKELVFERKPKAAEAASAGD